MDDVLAKTKTGRRIARNLAAGLCGLAAALALVLPTLRLGGFLPAWFGVMVAYLLPLPVACGFAVGFVSPRKMIVWAPLWSCIFAVLMSAILCGARAFAEISWSIVIGLTAVGALVAAVSGQIGQRAAARGYIAKSVVGLILVCCIMGGGGYRLLQSQERHFLQVGKPQVLLELDRDYFALPRGVDWACHRQIATQSYVLTSHISNQAMRVYAPASATALTHIGYELPEGHADLPTKEDARRYLKALGVRDPFMSGLATSHGCWRSVLRGTRLTIWSDGRVRFDAVPPRLPDPAPKGER